MNSTKPASTEVPAFLSTRFDSRQLKQIEFSMTYADKFNHGADGHNSMLIIAKLVNIIREMANPQVKVK
jgi:hypothetical protein